MKKVSAGVIITDMRDILIAHATGQRKFNSYDIFKGWVWFNIEKHSSAALRELKEESGIILKEEDLQDLGMFKYQPQKELHLYLYRSYNVKKEFNIKELKCTSIVPFRGYPEMDGYRICSIADARKYMYKGLYRVVYKALKGVE